MTKSELPLQIRFSDRAKRDFHQIQAYTLNNYGKQQAFDYVDKIERLLKAVQYFPYIGHGREDIPENYLCIPAEKHLIIYKVIDKTIFIAMILHGHEDIPSKTQHLN